jgi:hypothetical protein
MKRLLVVSILVFLVGFTGSAYAPDEFKFKVHIQIECGENNNLKTTMSSYIKRELRSLQDVEIIVKPEDASFILNVIAIEMQNKSGQKTGAISISFNFLHKYPTSILRAVLSKEDWRLLSDPVSIWKLPPLYFEPTLGVIGGNTADIDEICKDIVVKLDVDQFEPQREYDQKLDIK